MKNICKICLLAILFLLPLAALSQFSVSAELRPRFEIDNGALRPMPDSMSTDYFVIQRTRLKFDFNKEKYQMRLSIQDVRFWGSGDIYSSTGVWGSSAGLDIQEAWFRLRFGGHSELTFGRQVVFLDGQRLIAHRNWNQFGLSYDAIHYGYKRDKWTFNIMVSYNTNIELDDGKMIRDPEFFNVRNLLKTQNFVYLKRQFHKNFSASFIAMASGFQHSTSTSVIYVMGTYGFWWKFDNGKFDISGDLYYQNGKYQTGKDVSAYMLTLHPGYKFGKVRVGIGGDYISGDNAENDGYGDKERTFNKMYGAVFKYYGYMNYYTYMKASTANGGLIDIYPNVKVPFAKKHSIYAGYHKFYLANPVLLGTDIVDNTDLGHEIDLMYTYNILPEIVLQAGISYYFTTGTLEKVKKVDGTGIRSPYWIWTMITFKPNLFKN